MPLIEENFCLTLTRNLHLSMGTSSDEGGDIQFKKWDPVTETLCSGEPNIDVTGNITLAVSGDDSEIQIEEFNDIFAGGFFSVIGLGDGSQVQTKKEVKIEAAGAIPGGLFADVGILLTAPDDKGEVQVEEDNDLDATGGDILHSAAPTAPTAR